MCAGEQDTKEYVHMHHNHANGDDGDDDNDDDEDDDDGMLMKTIKCSLNTFPNATTTEAYRVTL